MSKTSGSKGRGRNRSNSSKRSPGRSNMHDSQSGRNRGNAQQLLDKYLSLARDSLSQGDRVAAENFFQHADHFQRIITEKNEKLEKWKIKTDLRRGHKTNRKWPGRTLLPIYSLPTY